MRNTLSYHQGSQSLNYGIPIKKINNAKYYSLDLQWKIKKKNHPLEILS